MSKANNRLPYGLCKRYGIILPDDATPHDAWEALKRKTGMSPQELFDLVDDEPGKRKSTAQTEQEPPRHAGKKNGQATPSGNGPGAKEAPEGSKGSGTDWYTIPDPKTFMKALTAAKMTHPEKDRWRVDDYSHTKEDYAHCQLFMSKGGSVVAVAPNGDIISLCRNKDDTAKGIEMMALAVEHGGVKLDSFSGNHGFYVKCGFEPVSWCRFDDRHAPPDWRKGEDDPEPIIFYMYTGKESEYTDEDEFMRDVPESIGYNEAQAERDRKIGEN